MFENIVEAAPCGMLIVDVAGRIVLVNSQAEMMFGYSRSELIGNPLEMLVPEHFRAAHAAHRVAFCRAPSMRPLGVDRDLTACRKNGSEFSVEIGLNPVPGVDGMVLAVVTDVTRRKTMQRALSQANSKLEEFTYAASHDLKSPLRGIADLIEWITEDLGGTQSPQIARNLLRVRERIGHLERVIDGLLAYARAGTAFTDAVPVVVETLIDGIFELLPRPAGFRMSVQIDALPFVTNKVPLESVLRNLIDNAIKHHDRPAGEIRVTAHDGGGYCIFSIADDGPGMFQTLAGGPRGHPGIGLALSKRLVETHGGWWKLESEAGARGTTFHVGWPRFPWRKTDD